MSKDVQLTPCQIDSLARLNGDENVFVTGAAGSGKSFLIQTFLRNQDKKLMPVLASTGAAAVLVGGRTFHSFFGLGILEGGVEATVEKAAKNRQVIRRLKEIKGFVLDEVSMLSGPTLRAAEVIARRIRRSDAPWGGLKLIFVGDFAQLPPVVRSGHERLWAFRDPVWEWSQLRTCYLHTQTRCLDEAYTSILNRVRNGLVDNEVRDYLNGRSLDEIDDFDGTRLFPRRDQTEKFNLSKLYQLEGETYTFETQYSGHERAVEQLKSSAPISEKLVVKFGALVMLRQNDPAGRWVNGSTGTIERITQNTLMIRLMSGRLVEIERVSFSLLDSEGEISAQATNFPVTLAWATTIHKSQGSTLDRLMVNLTNLWEPGQAYVALSRVARGADIWLESWSPNSIRADSEVLQFERLAKEQNRVISEAPVERGIS